jgi:ubiquinone/menaquinone biosynthesis C-methylase UbiE
VAARNGVFARVQGALQRFVWQRRVGSWEQQGSIGLGKVVDAILAQLELTGEEVLVDLGCGTGEIALMVAPRVREVIGVDIAPAMIARLGERARAFGLANVTGIVASLEEFELGPASVDVVVSNYVFHHLSDAAKEETLARIACWLRPGGQVVIGDMMLGRGRVREDRQVIARKVQVLARKGIGGWWRIAKNAVRYLVRVQERPVSRERWRQMLLRVGFAAVAVVPVVEEAAVAVARLPHP